MKHSMLNTTITPHSKTSRNDQDTFVFKIECDGKSCASGSSKTSVIISLSKNRTLKPYFQETSRTGNHWTDRYFLLHGWYLIVERYHTGNGNSYLCISKLSLNRDGTFEIEALGSYDSISGEYKNVQLDNMLPELEELKTLLPSWAHCLIEIPVEQ